MWSKIKTIIVTVLATLGVLFIIIMIIPDDEEDVVETEVQEVQEVSETQVAQEPQEVQESQEDQEAPAEEKEPEAVEASKPKEDTEETPAEDQNTNTVKVDIPASELSDMKLKFTTNTLDGKKVNQEIFSDYDITLVHVWGTFCGPCIAEMGKYANFYDTKPENVNLVGIICDVYDGIDNNVEDANEILNDAGAGFMNLRTSDSVYDITYGIDVIPASFLVDKEGRVIGEMMIGQRYDATISCLNEYLK